MGEGYPECNYSSQLIKSNYLIEANYNSPLFENKMMAVALMNIQKDTETGSLETRLPAAYLKKRLGTVSSSGGISDLIYKTSLSMMNRKVVMRNEKKEFRIWNIIIESTYMNGELHIVWNQSLEEYLYCLSSNFTKLNINALTSFKSNYSFRLYEMLMSRAYTKKDITDKQEYHITYGIHELRVKLGVTDANDAMVQKVIVKSAEKNDMAINYEEVEEKVTNKKLPSFKEFKRTAITKAVSEINNCKDSGIHIETKNITGGKGGKVQAIEFIVTKISHINNIETLDAVTVQEKKLENELQSYIKEMITIEDCRNILKAAAYDIGKAKAAYDVAVTSSKRITNLVGFMINAIKNNYSLPVEKIAENKVKNSFSQFPQRNYDYDELEKQLLNRK